MESVILDEEKGNSMERYMDHFREEHLEVLAEKTLFQGLTRDEIRAFIFYAKP